jgi:HK97 family phage major capsid protein
MTMLKERRALADCEVRAVEADDRTFEISFSSEYDQGERWYGIEVLSHQPGHVRLGRLQAGAAVLVDHETSRHVGTTRDARLDGGKGRVRTRFGSDADSEKVRLQVAEGIKKDVSVGYRVHHMTEMGQRADGSEYKRAVDVGLFASARRSFEDAGRFDRRAFLADLDKRHGAVERAADSTPKFLVDDWEPYEVSYVAIPFDPTVGLDRSLAAEAPATAQPLETPTMSDQTTAAPAATQQPDIRIIASDAIKAERERSQEIRAMGAAHGLQSEAEAAVNGDTSVHDFRKTVLEKLTQAGKITKAEDPSLGLSEKEVRQYSVSRLMYAMLEPNDRAAQKAAGFEIECSVEARKKAPIDEQALHASHRAAGFKVPVDVFSAPITDNAAAARAMMARLMQRDLSVGTTTAGGHLVATDLLAASFIELLRNRMVLGGLGITVLDGLVGNIAIPSMTAGASTYWVAEATAVTESQAAFGQVTMTPKTVGMFTDYSRKTLLQTTPSIEALVRADLAAGIAHEMDRVGLAGSGSGAEPTGVINTAGIGAVAGGTNGAAPTYANMVSLEEAVGVANADMGNLAYVTNAKMRAQLKLTQVFASTSGQPVWAGNEVNGYRAATTNAMPSTLTKGSSSGVCSAIAYGNWGDLMVGMWGGLDLILDPYALATAGGRRIVALQDCDVKVRRAASFAAMLDALRS